jgi:hypothetical protein
MSHKLFMINIAMALELVSPNSKTTKLKEYTGPTAISDAQKDAEKLANDINAEIVANVIANGKKISVPGNPTKDASDQNAYLVISKDKSGNISDPATTARLLATKIAAERNITTKVIVNGAEYTATPPARPSEIKNSGKGTPGTVAGTNMKEPNLRKSAIAAMEQAKRGSATDENDGGGSPEPTGSSSFEKAIQYNIPREASGKISTLEGVLDGVDGGDLKGVLGSLPGEFKSLLPAGSIPGLLKQSPIPLNNLLKIASGNSLGSIAGQSVKSVSSSVSVASNATKSLSAVSIGSTAVISNVVGAAVGNIISGNSVKINLPNVNIGSMVNVSLNSVTAIPTGLYGITTSSPAFGRLASVISGTTNGRVALLPTNLSIGALTGGVSGVTSALGGGISGAVSGISQKLSSFDTANIFSPDQLTNALPGNVSKLVSSGRPPRTYNPGAMGMSPKAGPFNKAPNSITSRRKAAPSQRTILPRGAAHPPKTPPSGQIKKAGQIDYGLVISPGGRTLGELVKAGTKGGYELPPDGHLGLSLDQIVEGLKYMATNAVDPLDQTFGKATIINGFRGPGGSDYGKSDHCFGAAVDLSWKSAAKHYEIAQWAVKYIKDSFVYLVFKYSGDIGYVHIAAGPNQKYKYPYPFGTTFNDGGDFKEGIQRPTWI